MRLPVILAFLSACASGPDWRAREVADIQQARVALDATFAAYYATEAGRAIQDVRARGGTFEDWLSRTRELNQMHATVIMLIRALDAALRVAVERLDAGQDGAVATEAREVLDRLVRMADLLSLPVPTIARKIVDRGKR